MKFNNPNAPKVQFVSVEPILKLTGLKTPGIMISNIAMQKMLRCLKQTVIGEFKKYTRKYYDLNAYKYGDAFEDVTDIKITGHPFTATWLEFPTRKLFYWITGIQDVGLRYNDGVLCMNFHDPITLWVSEWGKGDWLNQTEEEIKETYEEEVKTAMFMLNGFTLEPAVFDVTFHYVVDLIKFANHENLVKLGYF